MGKRLAIPRILGIDWWWLLVIGLFEGYVRFAMHVPQWVPSVSGLWMVGQVVWLKIAEPRSRSVYLYVVLWIGDTASEVLPKSFRHPQCVMDFLGVCLAVLLIVALFLFRDELEKHFRETDPRGIELNGFMTFFFNFIYFQYWFHQVYLEQHEVDLRLT